MNLASYVILGVVIILCVAAIYKIYIDKKKGNGCCSGGCSSCSSFEHCNLERKENKDDNE